jgi:hypothetical protein
MRNLGWAISATSSDALARAIASLRDVGDARLDLVLEARDDVGFPFIIASKPAFADIGRIVLFLRPDLGIHHLGAAEELVSVAPGMRQVTVIFVPRSSSRSTNANQFRNALAPL